MDLNEKNLKTLDGDQVVAFQTYEALSGDALKSTAPGKTQDRKKIAAFLAAELNATDPDNSPDPEDKDKGKKGKGKEEKKKEKPRIVRYSFAVRNKVIRLLGIVAGGAEVPALVTAMKELELREAARCALDRVQSKAATDALIAALKDVGPEFRVGVVGSLGDRSGNKVVKALQGLADDVDHEVRLAAFDALAKIPDAGSDAVLAAAAKCKCPVARQGAIKARVRLAETLARSGDKANARRIYEDIRRSDAAGAPQKKAAEIGIKAMG